MAIAPEVAAEYAGLTEGGAAAGQATLRQAESNVAARGAAKQAASARSGAPAGPLGAPRQRSSQRSSQQGGSLGPAAQQAYRQVNTPGKTAQTLTRVVWAVALGLIVLEVASEATGQWWDFKLPARGTLQKQPYRPLYGPGASSAAAALPGVMGQPASVQKTIADFPAGVF